MTNAPETRKTHVIRITGTNKNGDVLQDVWIDVERMDIVKSRSQKPDDGDNNQGLQRKFKWMDDPNNDDYNPDGNPARKLTTIKVCDVETQDPDDPDEWVPVQIIKSLKAKDSEQGVVDRYHTGDEDDPTVTTRVVEVRRIVHYDTNIDDDAQAAFSAGKTSYVVEGSAYQRDDSTKDDGQYVEHEIIKSLKHRTDLPNKDGGEDTGRQTKLLNQYLIDESDEATGEIVGASGINPPWRLDPFQNIVNVNFSVSILVVFCDFGPAAQPANRYATSFNPNKDMSVKLVHEFISKVQAIDGVTSLPVPCRIYKVALSGDKAAGQVFMTLSNPNPLALPSYAFLDIPTFVFAIDGSLNDSIQRAVRGTDLLLPAEYAVGRPIDTPPSSNIPYDHQPKGLLWAVGLTLPPGSGSHKIKLRYGPHRAGEATSDVTTNLPDKMWQVYQIGSTFNYPGGWGFNTIFGYHFWGYRLDKQGTGQFYGWEAPPVNWNQKITTPFDFFVQKGIPYGEPPFIGSDT